MIITGTVSFVNTIQAVETVTTMKSMKDNLLIENHCLSISIKSLSKVTIFQDSSVKVSLLLSKLIKPPITKSNFEHLYTISRSQLINIRTDFIIVFGMLKNC